jgi:hypothetical protein
LRILVLSNFDGTNATAIRDFLFSFNAHSRHKYYYLFDWRILDVKEPSLSNFDVILLYNPYLVGLDLSEPVRARIHRSDALKVLFLQDEYRDVRAVNRAMRDLGIQVMFTCVAEEEHETFYPKALIPTLEATYTVLPGYVPAYLEEVRVNGRVPRPIDVGYRSRVMPYYLGDLGQEKRLIAERFEGISREQGFRSDISVRETDRVYGSRWLKFLASSRFVLGTASGASVVDFSGDIRRNCERYLSLHPTATYEEVKERFFADADWKVVIDTMSPRIFEATALGCTLVQHEGGYAGVLDPDTHYICVRKDYANIEDVIDRMKDVGYCREMAENAHRDLIASGAYSYRAFVEEFDRRMVAHVREPLAGGGVSRVQFYARNFLRHGQTIIPYRVRFAVLPSGKLIQDVVGRAVSRLRHRRGPALGRLVQNPGDFFSKGLVSTRITWGARNLRKLVMRYLRDRALRRSVPYHQLMNDLVKLDVVRQARTGVLRSRQPFRVSVSFEREAGALTIASGWDPRSPAGLHAGGSSVGPAADLRGVLMEAFRAREIKAMVWDHSALGLQIVYQPSGSKWVTIGLGAGGVYRFDALAELARRYPDEVAGILVPILMGDRLVESAGATRGQA